MTDEKLEQLKAKKKELEEANSNVGMLSHILNYKTTYQKDSFLKKFHICKEPPNNRTVVYGKNDMDTICFPNSIDLDREDMEILLKHFEQKRDKIKAEYENA